ncbi:Hsp70 family protein [Rhodococcus electrodiphilus]|uniref:Hsp70 family protein n=1 Tax=Rhodococcus ruber TaxID=1830 RepID=UPI0026F457D3|nr:Hsp70 family protein [Rhodococcus ruber]MDO2379730.1 Hsp70 family protein [Rhodococcus ruber]
MRTSLGISTGASGVGSALVVEGPGEHTTEYRFLASDPETAGDLGDLVIDALSLMSTQIDGHAVPDAVAVAYRTSEHAEAIRSASVRDGHIVHLVPETTAVLAYLNSTGLVDTADTLAVADLGASGFTVSVVDRRSGSMLRSARTGDVGGGAVRARVYDHVRRRIGRTRGRIPIDPALLTVRCQGALEALGEASTTRIELGDAGPAVPLTRTELDEMVADLSDTAATFTRRVCHTEPRPQMLALVGGAAAMPALADAVTSAFAGPVAVVPEPATAAAHGAALLAASSRLSSYPSVGASTPTAGTPGGKVSGALAGALVIGALVAGYATDQIASDDTAVSPAGTSGQATTQPAAAVPDTGHTQIPSEDPHAAVTTTAADNGYARTDTPVPYPTPTVPESSTTTPATTTPPSTPESTTSERPESPADVPGTDRPWQLPGTLPSVPLPTVPLPTLPGTTPSESTTPSSTTSAPPSEFAPPETTTETSSTAAPAEEATSTSPPLIEPSPAA